MFQGCWIWWGGDLWTNGLRSTRHLTDTGIATSSHKISNVCTLGMAQRPIRSKSVPEHPSLLSAAKLTSLVLPGIFFHILPIAFFIPTLWAFLKTWHHSTTWSSKVLPNLLLRPWPFVLYLDLCHLLTHVPYVIVQMMSEMWCVHQKEFIFPYHPPPAPFFPISPNWSTTDLPMIL